MTAKGNRFDTAGGVNSAAEVNGRLQADQLSRLWVWLILPARLVFALMTFGLVTLIAQLGGAGNPTRSAGSWWMVSGTLIDAGSLMALTILVRREGIRLRDLLAPGRQPWAW